MKNSEIINLLGGTSQVSRYCGVSAAAVCQWRSNGIPDSQMIRLASDLEKKSNGAWTRKEIPNWQQIWADLS